jgi:hypothetical protein
MPHPQRKREFAPASVSKRSIRTSSGHDSTRPLRDADPTPALRRARAVPTRSLAHGDILVLQRALGNRAVQRLLDSEPNVIQRTIDQDARRWAMDWTATWQRAFAQEVKRLQLPKLYALITGILGEEYPTNPGAPPPSREQKAKYTTALAAALVKLGEVDAGKLAQRLQDKKPGLDGLLGKLETLVPDKIPELHLETPQSQQRFARLDLPDPFMVLRCGGAEFVFSREMALHMLRRHHPDYLSGPPLMVQSFFEPGTTINQIKALIEGTIRSSEKEIKAWRGRRAKMKGAQLDAPEATTLNLRPFYDGRHWELTLSLDSPNPTESKGRVAHFTPTL